MENGIKTKELKKIRDEVMNLKDSPLYTYRTENNYFPVLGEGNHNANIVFVGEAPGENEAKTGRPFCGAAGRILTELLGDVGIKREEVYITNIVKDRPPKNRDPEPLEIALYAPFLDRQINIIEPKIIAALGRFSAEYIMKNYGLSNELAPISSLHGKVFTALLPYGEVKIMPLFHPAASIYNRTTREDLKKDFIKLKKIIDSSR